MNEPLTPAQEEQMEQDLKTLLKPPKTSARMGTEIPDPEAKEIKPRGVWHWRRFPMGGWLYWQAPAWMQREDQGQDFETTPGHHIIAPGWGKCIHHLNDRPWPGGFGSPYPVVYIGSGRFGRNLWYVGHNNSEVIPEGATFHTGAKLSLPTHSLNPGRVWTELGHAPGGYPGWFGEGARYHNLFTPLWRWSST